MDADLLARLGLAAGGAVASGLRLYGTVAALGLLQRFGVLKLPPGLAPLGATPVIALASALYVVEFVADKVPLMDSIWDAVHTFVRVPAGAVLGFAALGDVQEPWRILAGLLCGGIALSSHGLKSSTRLAANASPEPFTNLGLSLGEDLSVIGLLWLVVAHPVVALLAAAATLALAVFVAAWITRSIRTLFRRPRATA